VKYKTIFISDLHLGGPCDYEALHDFLRDNDADTWYIVGDFIDFWAIKRTRSWPNEASMIIQKLLHKSRKAQQIIILPGNHDSELRKLEDFSVGNIRIVDKVIHEIRGQKILVL
jgi:UDP-2,3-diacylglucosamine pyrophosphatase LpxH